MHATLQSVAANVIEKIADDLILSAQATPEDRARWQPSAPSFLHDFGDVNTHIAQEGRRLTAPMNNR